MNSLRKYSLAAGIFYLLTFVSIPTLALTDPYYSVTMNRRHHRDVRPKRPLVGVGALDSWVSRVAHR